MALSLAIAGAADLAGILATFRPKRKLADFTAMVTIEEDHRDELVITDHPVDQASSTISDHAYKLPAQVTLTLGWSDSFGLQSLLGSGLSSVHQVYQKLLQLQASRVPFKIVTGKRNYDNMLVKAISTSTRRETENALIVTVICREIQRVSVIAVAGSTPPNVQADPQETADVADTGQQQLQSAPGAPDFNAPPYTFDPLNP